MRASSRSGLRISWGRIRVWIDTHTDQVIIVASLVLGLWLVGKSIYLIVT